MNKILPATLVALLAAPSCGGRREENPDVQSPASPAPSGPATEIPPKPEVAPVEPPAETAPTSPAPAPKPPLAELERDAVRNMISGFNAHDAHKLSLLYAPEARIGGASPQGWREDSGPQSVERVYTQLFAAFPDIKGASPRVYQTGPVVIQEWVWTGTHRGDLGSMKATDRQIGVVGASVYRFDDDGLILREDTYYNTASVLAQIGGARGKARPIPELPAGDPQFVTASGTNEENRWIDAAKTLYTAYDNRDEKGFAAGLAKTVSIVDHTATSDVTGAGPARESFRAFVRVFPDVKVTSRDVWGFGDRVVAEVTYSGTQTGIYAGVRPSKKPVNLHALEVLRFDDDGKLLERTVYASTMELSAPASTTPSVPGKGKTDATSPDAAPGTDTQPPSPGYHMSPGGNQYFPGPNPYPGAAPRPGATTAPVPNPPGSGIQ